MTDIVERLRAQYDAWNNPPSPELPDGAGVTLDAAAEIERLRAALDEAQQAFALESYNAKRLRAALGEIAKTTYGYEPFMPDEEAKEYFKSRFFGAQAKARAALKEDGDEK